MSEARGPNPPDQPEGPSWKPYVVDLVSSAGAVVLVGAMLFAVSGVWPPLVAIESESMAPNIHVGDLVFVMDEQRFPGEGAEAGTGVVTARAGSESGYAEFTKPGDVVVYKPDGSNETTPIIHRAMFWVEEDERWYDRADPDYVGAADSCEELAHCPANSSGFITKGDNNPQYDQVVDLSNCRDEGPCKPVRSEWVVGTAEGRIPYLGCIRLRFAAASPTPEQCQILG